MVIAVLQLPSEICTHILNPINLLFLTYVFSDLLKFYYCIDDNYVHHAEFLRRAGEIRRLYRTAPTTVAPPVWRTAAAAAQQAQPAADARAFCPTDFGADPTGLVDSTQAVLRAVDSMLAECAGNGTAPTAARPMAPGVRNCGGAVLDLRGGTYLISAPVVIPVHCGNLNINGGTLRASATFPANRSLVELGNKAVKNGAEFINVHEVFFDSSHVAAGGLLIANCISVRW